MEQIVNQIIKSSIDSNASDIHFIPCREAVQLKQRIDGEMHFVQTLELHHYERILAYLKFVSRLDVADKKKAQSGVVAIIHEDQQFHVRVSTLPQSIGTEAAVLRILKAQFTSRLIDNTEILYETMKLSHGLILITGPTGSGKSTLMYNLLAHARQTLNRQIITIEDPVEQILEDTIQISVNEKAEITFQNSFKAILRCDPDIVMIGEIRDELTAKQVINASLSGHLVLSTLHASDTPGAVERLLEMGIRHSELKQSVKLITSQRLIKSGGSRKLVIETLTNAHIHQLLAGQPLQAFNPLLAQIQQLHDGQLITTEELEKFRVVNQ
ncbi:competence type IV pilus ATPase ComGA [Macrococcus equipercicus]|uniref:Flp pilus assembly complex ATPase component TadA n=1 Tax=Macrococcus equipercicus TaxID=69967 RepID=A0A9Q9F2L0_9STAP|nr:competence type IV pilus ATPase ComGA [Macrococcus equipercicus]KAA1040109.1 type II/IV secretion system protein [Macrococcus equipercicus]UTH12944.1 Flp pilus assembly complex ATPase component TadA [Macrococcus equipercicus]